MIIAVDFDGTICDHEYPEIGKPKEGAFETLKDLQKAGHQIILWTCRCGYELSEALLWLRRLGFIPNAVNANVCDCRGYAVPKIVATVYIDDRNFGGFPGWDRVRKSLLEPGTVTEALNNLPNARGDKPMADSFSKNNGG
jgi:hypothetical protein